MKGVSLGFGAVLASRVEKQFEFKVTQFGISSKVVRRTGLDLAQSPAASETLGKSAAATH